MHIDKNYLLKLFVAFEENDKPYLTVFDLIARGIQVYVNNEKHECRLDSKFMFHIQLLVEEELIVDHDLTLFKTMEDIGILFDEFGDAYDIDLNCKMLWLTTIGHKRLEDLTQSEVRDNLIDEIKKSPAKALATGVAETMKLAIKGFL
ncbi:hypothetical protein OA7_0007840 [Vibrio cyclitrophicus 1F53]|uniref:hypothetical protein n=1 Tax=Vibrio TaxID=662 RepID=UPI000364CBD8|nr:MULTISPECIES: hypothetical protein [Vibrio]OEF32246.1 hypothetical protein OA7_17090 [Vibrio cyclitrophicus 1F53]OEF65605.1 hypothetical protein OAA_02330 [Vibrio cyclitrophicus 1F175]PMH25592.1 hypothetical protein BCU72_04875 [Vibrio cyclitrophicus]PMH83734.1 hypothetical protein BCU60_13240 [Vibrio cyclitrophicus]